VPSQQITIFFAILCALLISLLTLSLFYAGELAQAMLHDIGKRMRHQRSCDGSLGAQEGPHFFSHLHSLNE
jgi:hypothetical protein